MKEVKNFDVNGKYIASSEEEANALRKSPFCAKEVKDSTIYAEFESFLDLEMDLGISDKKTIERIKWYWNTYFKNKQQPKADNVVDGWISVGERLPKQDDGDENEHVLIYLRQDRQSGHNTRKFAAKWFRVSSDRHTHWMPMPPEPPSKQ